MKHRGRLSSLNNSLLLTYGNPIGLSALSTRLNVAYESFSAICPATKSSTTLAGQVQHIRGDRSAHLSYLLPDPVVDHPGLAGLIDFLCIHAGEMGAFNLLAEAKDSDELLEALRKNNFSIYGWETIWLLPQKLNQPDGKFAANWHPMTAVEEPNVRSLYQTLVPPLVQTSEVYPGTDIPRLIYQNASGDIVAYVESLSGPKGIYLKPIIHPSIEKVDELLLGLAAIFQGLGKPVYLQMRSYQAWITAALEDMGALTTVHFALLVRHLAINQFATAAHRVLQFDKRQAEPNATPMVNKMSDPGQMQK